MQAVGRIGSYISRSVYTVSGPFHPFGGAVDIIVVQQPDGSYKSSPWYVRFGKFQGVLKAKEKVVNISVNGVESDFHMYLDHKGEAFFLKEVDDDGVESACSPPSSSGEDTDRQTRNRPVKTKSCNFDSEWSNSVDSGGKPVVRTNSKRAQILGLVFGRGSKKEEEEEQESGVVRTESLERAEIAADLLDLKWSTNLASPREKKDNASCFSSVDISKDEGNEILKVDDDGCGCDEAGVVSRSSYKEVEFTVEENGVEMKCLTSEYAVENVGEDTTLTNDKVDFDRSDYCVSAVEIVAKSDSQSQEHSKLNNGLLETSSSEEENAINSSQSFNNFEALDSSGVEAKNTHQSLGLGDHFGSIQETVSVNGGTLTECYSEIVSVPQLNDSLNKVVDSPIEEQTALEKDDVNKHAFSVCDPEISVEEQLLFGDMDGFNSTDAKQLEFIRADDEVGETDSSFLSGAADVANDHSNAESCVGYSLEQSVITDYINGRNIQKRSLRSISSDVCISEKGHAQSDELTRMVRSLPTMGHLSSNLESSNLGRSSDPLLYPDVSSGANNNHGSPCAKPMPEDVKILKVAEEEPTDSPIGIPPRPIEPLRGSRRSWPFFKKSRSMKFSQADKNGSVDPNAIDISNNSSDLQREKDSTKLKVNKKIVKTLTPSSEQLASLNLKEGKNTVVFTFSTAMLGKQQVDARIFLWRWDTRIVISDVDGTITRSDLLGQVMPLVGMDWSQTGVAHLFSAIKENGYQLLFLSARSISQSFLTRQFLFNIKQDGKALPEGPVVISPDGLFPSLFREVVRRAPHEFKIACLEDIKALFPADTNPFYAGFGNRDTDEFSYLKVGIPIGKIFIINPKGEIVVNRRVDTKSYTTLHGLVHGMFPSTCSSEKEDFNSWNFWKLPPPNIDL